MVKFTKKNNVDNKDEKNKTDNTKDGKNKINIYNKENNFLKSFFSKLKWLDPFTYVDLLVMPKVKKFSDNKIVEHFVNILFAGIFAFIIYSFLGIMFGTSSPLVIVYSESMEPDFFRGDIIGLTSVNENTFFGKEINLKQNISNVPTNLFATPVYLNNSLEKIIFNDNDLGIQEFVFDNNIKNNPVIVYNAYPLNIPIIHRAIVKINALDGEFVLTKGDNPFTNPTFDQDCGKIDSVRLLVEKNCITFYAIPIKDIQGTRFFQIPKIGCVKLWLFDDLISLITKRKLPDDFKGIC
ncbi:MAG: hypothetical protein PHX27_04390 [Candidatus ainarchaeum sp.]|nr:hypothetical protein [Candidatus ainarchaeum sp.]